MKFHIFYVAALCFIQDNIFMFSISTGIFYYQFSIRTGGLMGQFDFFCLPALTLFHYLPQKGHGLIINDGAVYIHILLRNTTLVTFRYHWKNEAFTITLALNVITSLAAPLLLIGCSSPILPFQFKINTLIK